MNNNIRGIVIDPGHPSYVFPNVRGITNKNL